MGRTATAKPVQHKVFTLDDCARHAGVDGSEDDWRGGFAHQLGRCENDCRLYAQPRFCGCRFQRREVDTARLGLPAKTTYPFGRRTKRRLGFPTTWLSAPKFRTGHIG